MNNLNTLVSSQSSTSCLLMTYEINHWVGNLEVRNKGHRSLTCIGDAKQASGHSLSFPLKETETRKGTGHFTNLPIPALEHPGYQTMAFPHATKAFPWPMPLLSVKTRSLGVILHISEVASPTPHDTLGCP